MKALGRRGCLWIVIGLLVAILGIAVIAYFARGVVTPRTVATPPPPVTESVVVANRGILAGTVLGSADLTTMDIQVELAPLNRLTDPNQAIGKVAGVTLVSGEMVLPHHLVDTTKIIDRTLAFQLEDDQVLMAFPIVDLMSSLNILKRGDLVDILISMPLAVQKENQFLAGEEEPPSLLYTLSAMQRVTITAVIVNIVEQQQAQNPAPTPQGATPQPPPDPSRTQSEPVALMLALSPQDALVLKHLKDAGALFDIVLRSPTSTQYFETTPVTEDFLIDKYQLEVPR